MTASNSFKAESSYSTKDATLNFKPSLKTFCIYLRDGPFCLYWLLTDSEATLLAIIARFCGI